MNFIQTFYIDPDKDPFRDSFGWVAPEYHLMGWALSSLLLHKIYGKVALYVNSPAAHLLIDTLQLPYSDVQVTHDKLTLPHPDLWALPKFIPVRDKNIPLNPSGFLMFHTGQQAETVNNRQGVSTSWIIRT